MRVLMVHPGPAFSVADVYRGWAQGFREVGADVQCLNLDDMLQFFDQAQFGGRKAVSSEEAAWLACRHILSAALDWWPDVVVIVSGWYVPRRIYEVLRARGRKVVLIHTESPYQDDEQLYRAGAPDLNVVNDPTNLDRFRAIGPSEYIPHAADPRLHCPGPVSADLRSDFAFCGTGFPRRIEFLEAVDWTGIDVALAGFWQGTDPDSVLRKFVVHDLAECFDNSDTIDLYRSSKLSANLYREPQGWAMGPREVEMAAIGLPFLREPRGEGDDVLSFLPRFTDPGDFTDQARYLLAHDDLRLALGRRCREAVADRTFAANAAHLLRLLDR